MASPKNKSKRGSKAAPATPAPVAAEPHPGLSEDARRKSADKKRRNRIYDRYMQSLQPRAADDSDASDKGSDRDAARRAERAELQAMLDSKTRIKAVPVYDEEPTPYTDENGNTTLRRQRSRDPETGKALMQDQPCPLKPAEILRYTKRVRQLDKLLAGKPVTEGTTSLRDEFIAMLPTYAAETDCDAELLELVGVPRQDLIDAGMIEAEDSPAE